MEISFTAINPGGGLRERASKTNYRITMAMPMIMSAHDSVFSLACGTAPPQAMDHEITSKTWELTSAIAKSGAQLVVASRNLGRLQQLSDEETKRRYRVHGETYDQGDDSEGVVDDHPSDLGFMRQAK
jgi:hypothetical protein